MLKILKLGNLAVVLSSLLIMITTMLILINPIISIYVLGLGLLVGLVTFCWGIKEIKFFEKLNRRRLLEDAEKWVCMVGIVVSSFLPVSASLMLMGILPSNDGFVDAYYPILIASYPLWIVCTLRALWMLEPISIEEYLYG